MLGRGGAKRGGPRRGFLEDFSRWHWPAAALVLAVAAIAWFSGERGADPEPLAPRRGAPAWSAVWQAELRAVSEYTEILAEIEAAARATRDDPCSSPLHFVWVEEHGWMLGVRGAYLPLPPETVQPDWLAVLEGLRARGRESVMEVDVYRLEGLCG